MQKVNKAGDNVQPETVLPDDHAEAVTFVFNRYKKLVADRRWSSDRMKDVYADAKSAGVSADDLRLAIKLSRLTPEKRLEMAERLKKQLKAYGYTVDTTAEDAPQDPQIAAFLKRAGEIRIERDAVRDAMKDLNEAAKAYSDGKDATRQIRMEYIKLLAKLSEADDENSESPAGDWFDGLDALGTFLRLW